jgi:hypothetical protein
MPEAVAYRNGSSRYLLSFMARGSREMASTCPKMPPNTAVCSQQGRVVSSRAWLDSRQPELCRTMTPR